MIDGLNERTTSGGVQVLRLHYSSDPGKRPGTEVGDVWLDGASKGYIGGMTSPRWRKEMEIDYGALGGTRVFPEWEQWLAYGSIVIAPFQATGYRLFASYDHGWRNPAAYHIHGIDSDGNIVTLWEFYDHHVPVPQISRIILGDSVTLGDGRRFAGSPYAGADRPMLIIADPSIWAEDQPMADNTNKSIAELFRRAGVTMSKGERGGDHMAAEWLHGHYWKDPRTPLYRITTDCPKLIWEIGQQRHRDVSARVALHRDQPEQLVDKDNHAWDGLKMFFNRFPPKAMPRKAEQKPNTFQWWRRASQAAQRGEKVGTFRV